LESACTQCMLHIMEELNISKRRKNGSIQKKTFYKTFSILHFKAKENLFWYFLQKAFQTHLDVNAIIERAKWKTWQRCVIHTKWAFSSQHGVSVIAKDNRKGASKRQGRAGLPDAIFSYPKSQFVYIWEGLGIEDFGIFYHNLVSFTIIWYLLQ
jgi:hypothetical protein